MVNPIIRMDTGTPGVSDGRFEIEKAGWRDLNELRHLEKACFPKDAWPLLDLIGVLTLPNVIHLKAVMDGHMIGFIAVDIHKAEQMAWIATIGVLPEHRRKGIAAALLEAGESLVDVPRMRLCVRKSNIPAIRLYEQFGYWRASTWPRYYQDGEDALVMEKQLEHKE